MTWFLICLGIVAVLLIMGLFLPVGTFGQKFAWAIDVLCGTLFFRGSGLTISTHCYMQRSDGTGRIWAWLADVLDKAEPNAGGTGIPHCLDAVRCDLTKAADNVALLRKYAVQNAK